MASPTSRQLNSLRNDQCFLHNPTGMSTEFVHALYNDRAIRIKRDHIYDLADKTFHKTPLYLWEGWCDFFMGLPQVWQRGNTRYFPEFTVR